MLFVATAPTVYGIETNIVVHDYFYLIERCDNTYRLRYATQGARQQRSKATMRSAHLKYLNEEKVKQRWSSNSAYRLRYWNFIKETKLGLDLLVATVLTVHGIETQE